jgi:hypothetical protein
MTSTSQYNKEFGPDPGAGRPVEVRLIQVGSPEHAAMLAEGARRAARQRISAIASECASLEAASQPGGLSEWKPVTVQIPESGSPRERHERKCAICAHPERDEIDESFLHWHSPLKTAALYQIPLRSLHRHAHATGLYAERQGNLRSVLDRVLERAETATVSGDCVIRAVRAYSCLGDDNEWTEPASRVMFSSQSLVALATGTTAKSKSGAKQIDSTAKARHRRRTATRAKVRGTARGSRRLNRHSGD